MKSEPLYLYHIYWSLCREFNWKKSLLVICKLLRMFVKILTADDKYSLLNRNIWRTPFQMQLSQKQKIFSQFVSAFLKCWLNFEQFKTKMTLIADVFPKLRIPKSKVKKISKKSSFRGTIEKQHEKKTKYPRKLNPTAFTRFIDHCEVNWVGKSVSYWYAKS